MVIDEMVYDPASEEGSFKANLVHGAFSFVSDEIAKTAPDAMTISTPVATIGIRGTRIAGRAAQEGSQNTISLLPETDVSGNPHVGELSIANSSGTVILNQIGATVQMTSAFAPPPAPVVFSAPQIQQSFGSTLTTLSATVAAQANSKAKEASKAAEDARAEAEPAVRGPMFLGTTTPRMVPTLSSTLPPGPINSSSLLQAWSRQLRTVQPISITVSLLWLPNLTMSPLVPLQRLILFRLFPG